MPVEIVNFKSLIILGLHWLKLISLRFCHYAITFFYRFHVIFILYYAYIIQTMAYRLTIMMAVNDLPCLDRRTGYTGASVPDCITMRGI